MLRYYENAYERDIYFNGYDARVGIRVCPEW